MTTAQSQVSNIVGGGGGTKINISPTSGTSTANSTNTTDFSGVPG